MSPQPAPSDSGIAVVADDLTPLAPSDSGIIITADPPRPDLPGGFDLAFRQAVAGLILDALIKGYVTNSEYVRGEARRRGLSVEQLLAAYLARTIMHKVDGEYV
jgi:hypothetical protein